MSFRYFKAVEAGNAPTARDFCKVTLSGPGRTKQSFKDDCDINKILGRYAKGGVINHLAKYEGTYGVFDPMEFRDAMEIVRHATEMFEDLDSSIRKRFGQDPKAFLDFVQEVDDKGNLKNIDEMRKMGLARAADPAKPTPVQARIAELDVDAAARLELARRAVTAPPGAATQ